MTSTLWIAVGATVLMIAAHIFLFWWFLVRLERKNSDQDASGETLNDFQGDP